jgi:SAM-dependent methyltransferase
VLDLGCGTGTLVAQLKRHHPDLDVVGVDPDPRALARTRRKAKRARVAAPTRARGRKTRWRRATRRRMPPRSVHAPPSGERGESADAAREPASGEDRRDAPRSEIIAGSRPAAPRGGWARPPPRTNGCSGRIVDPRIVV